MTPEEYNLRELAAGRITPLHITTLVRKFQASELGQGSLLADGKLGPKTRSALEADAPSPLEPLIVDANGWLVGAQVVRVPAHQTWFPVTKARSERSIHATEPQRPGVLYGGGAHPPRAIVWHYTATGTNAAGEKDDPVKPGTAMNMANRRTRPLSEEDRVASWHVTIETDGTIVQMIPFVHGAWHVRQNCPDIPGAGKASLSAVGVELVGWGKSFTDAQVTAAKRLGRALVTAYPSITLDRFGITHKELDPTRRNDPGPVWAEKHAGPVARYAFEGDHS